MFRILILILILFSLSSCSSPEGTWGWYVIDPTTKAGWTNIKFLIGGFYSTILLSIIAAFLSIFIGLIVALPAMSDNKLLKLFNRIYVEFI